MGDTAGHLSVRIGDAFPVAFYAIGIKTMVVGIEHAAFPFRRNGIRVAFHVKMYGRYGRRG